MIIMRETVLCIMKIIFQSHQFLIKKSAHLTKIQNSPQKPLLLQVIQKEGQESLV